MRSTVLICALAALAAAQDTGTVEGVVVNKVTGAGIPEATVRFFASRNNRFETRTDATGAFRFTAVKPGDYDAGVQKDGYFSVDLSGVMIFPGDRPKYHVDPSGAPLHVRLELNPPAIIRGRVIGADGNPARAFVDLGRGRTVSTDTDGAFMFDKLSPGPYTLLARPKTVEHAAPQNGIRSEAVATYYPSAVNPGQAQMIVVPAGAELIGYEIHLQSVPVYPVRGVVLNPDGTPASKAVVNLQPRFPGENPDHPFLIPGGKRPSFSIRTAEIEFLEPADTFVTAEDGKFEFPSVPSGDWMVQVEGDPIRIDGQREPVSSYGAAALNLGHGDPDELKIELATSFRLSGVAVLDDGSPPRDLILGVSLSSDTGRAGSGGMTEAGGTLRLDVIPGANRMQAEVMLGNYYVDSIQVGSVEATKQKIELTRNSPPVKIVLKPAGTIHATIEEGAAGTVVLFPQTVEGIAYWSGDVAAGTIDIPGIPPGDYYAIALDHFDSRTMAGAVRLRSLIPMAASVSVASARSSNVQLRVNRVPD